MEQDVVKPNIDYLQSRMEDFASSFYTKLFKEEPFALLGKTLETLRWEIGKCRSVEELKVFVESTFKFYPGEGKEQVTEVVEALSTSANLRNIKDGDYIVLISDLDPSKEITAVANAGADKRYRRFMIKSSDTSSYYLAADEVISLDLLSKIHGLFSLKARDECLIEQENRREQAFPVIEHIMKKPFAKGLETVLRYAFNKMFSKFQEDFVNRFNIDKSTIFYNILRDFLDLNTHLSIKVNSPDIYNSKVSIYFEDSGEIAEGVKIIGKEGDYYYRDLSSGKLYVLDLRSDFVIFKHEQYKEFERLAREDTRVFVRNMIDILLNKLNIDKYNGTDEFDIEVKTSIPVKHLIP